MLLAAGFFFFGFLKIECVLECAASNIILMALQRLPNV